MKQIVVGSIGLALAGGAVAGVTVLIGVDRTDLVVGAYLVLLGGLVAQAAARIAGRAFPAPRQLLPRLLARPLRTHGLPESLAIAEDEVALAQADQFNLHFRLRPVLVEIAEAGLATEAGIDLTRDPDRARERLSPKTWELVRPDRPRPESGDEGGISTESLSAVVADLARVLPS